MPLDHLCSCPAVGLAGGRFVPVARKCRLAIQSSLQAATSFKGGSDCAASASSGQSGEASDVARGGRRAGRDSL